MNSLALSATLAWAAAGAPTSAAGWPDLGHPPAGPGVDGRRDAAVVVGIEDYRSLPDVPGAVDNADDWVRWLARTRGVPLSRIHSVRDRRATRDRIVSEVERARDEVRAGGTLWLVYVGRGAEGGVWTADAPRDAQPEALFDFASMDAALDGHGGAQAVVVVDAGVSVKMASSTVFSSSAGGGGPLGMPDMGRPALSYLVLGALRGWADTNNDAVVSAREVARFVEDGLTVVDPDGGAATVLTGPDADLALGAREPGPDLVEMALSRRHDVVVDGGTDADFAALAEQAAAMEAAERAARARTTDAREALVRDRAARLARAAADLQAEATAAWADLTPALESGGARSVALVERFVEAYATARVRIDDQDRTVLVPEVDDARSWLADIARATAADPLARPVLSARTSARTRAVVMADWQACVSLSDPAGCTELGDRYAHALDGLDLHPAKAAALYQRGCDHLDASACHHLGGVLQLGVGVTADPPRARTHFQAGCDLGSGAACGHLGLMVGSGQGGPPTPGLATDLFARGCDMDDGFSCRLLAEKLAVGDGADPARAAELLDRACGLGERAACLTKPVTEAAELTEGTVVLAETGLDEPVFQESTAGDTKGEVLALWEGCRSEQQPSSCNKLGYRYEAGSHGLYTDIERAAHLYARACDLGVAMACGNVGYLLESGQLGAHDYRAANARYQAGCQAGNARSCGNLGVLYDHGLGVLVDKVRANMLFDRACTLGSGAACTNLGFNFETGAGVPSNERRALGLYETGCDREDYRGCGNLGYLLWTGQRRRQDHTRAREYLRVACEHDDARSCNNVAIMLSQGAGGPTDLDASNRYIERGCDLGDANACRNLGLRYRDGTRGKAVDLGAARFYLNRACSMDNGEACAELGGMQ